MKKILRNSLLMVSLIVNHYDLHSIPELEDKAKDLVDESIAAGFAQELFEYLYYKRVFNYFKAKEELGEAYRNAWNNLEKFEQDVPRANKATYEKIKLLFNKADELIKKDLKIEAIILENLFDKLKVNSKVQFKYRPKKNYYISWRDVL